MNEKLKELEEKLRVMLPRSKAGNDMLKSIIRLAKQQAKEKAFDDIDKELNYTLKAFGKLMQEYKIDGGVQTKLLVPFY
ncbi:unnamed protein product, partial [marine sediment metagenome]